MIRASDGQRNDDRRPRPDRRRRSVPVRGDGRGASRVDRRPHAEYTIRELGRLLDYSHPAVRNTVDVLQANDLVTVEAAGNRKHVSIERGRLTNPDEPVLRIPQAEFHEPVQAAFDRLREELTTVKGVLVFGSVARGEADRRSDVDLWVLVQEDHATNQRTANEIVTGLGEKRFDGERYEFQILVESVRSALNYGDRLTDVLGASITLYEAAQELYMNECPIEFRTVGS